MPKLIPLDRNQWLLFTRQFQDYSYRQSWDYGTLLANKRNAKSEHVGIFEGEIPIALADVRVKEIPWLGGGLAFISFGPLAHHGKGSELSSLREALSAIKEEYARKRNLLLRIQPPLSDLQALDRVTEIFRESGFQQASSSKSYRTFFLDLSPPLEEIRGNLSRRWRRHLSQSEREEIEIEVRSDAASLTGLVEFHGDFVTQKGFQTDLDAEFYTQVQEVLPDHERFQTIQARFQGHLVAAIVESLLGDTMVYLLGGRNEIGSRIRASYRLHWEAIRIAKEKGIRWYDLGGIDPEENEGVFVFKQGFGGVDTTAPGPFEYQANSFRATLMKKLEAVYRFKRMAFRG